jgi:Mg-chelatase subunit ChlD
MYSVVGFATEVTQQTLLLPPKEALQELNGVEYSGGRTNHADAINTCHESLSAASQVGNPKNLIILITDGTPSEPQDAPEAAAEEAAAQAKNDGVNIIPVTIGIPSGMAYLQGISSDGQVFGVDDFDELDSLQEAILDQVFCPGETPSTSVPPTAWPSKVR